MKTTRDLGRIEPWQESLERSLARRGEPPFHYRRLAPKIGSAAGELEPTPRRRTRGQAGSRRRGLAVRVMGLGMVSALALLAATTIPSILAGRSRRVGRQVVFTSRFGGRIYNRQSRSSANGHTAIVSKPSAKPVLTRSGPAAVHITRTVAAVQSPPAMATKPVTRKDPTSTHSTALKSSPAAPKPAPAAPTPAPVNQTRHHRPSVHRPHGSKPRTSPVHHAHAHRSATHRPHGFKPAVSPGGYVNPLAHARVTPERIDQGVDYSGTGTLTSIGRARVTYVATSGTGWPGAFIEYRLLQGFHVGRYVYYAEGVRPAKGIRVGAKVRAGQPVAQLIPGWSSGIEIGWGAGAGTETYAHQHGEYVYPTQAGKSFSALIASLGGPPGRG